MFYYVLKKQKSTIISIHSGGVILWSRKQGFFCFFFYALRSRTLHPTSLCFDLDFTWFKWLCFSWHMHLNLSLFPPHTVWIPLSTLTSTDTWSFCAESKFTLSLPFELLSLIAFKLPTFLYFSHFRFLEYCFFFSFFVLRNVVYILYSGSVL